MTITEASRHLLHEALIDKLGEEEASTLMEYLPPVGWADVATKTDIEHLRVATSSDVEHLRVATGSDLEHLRVAMDAGFSAVHARMDGRFEAVDHRFEAFEAKMDGRFEAVDQRFDSLESRFTATLATTLTSHVRWVVATIFASYAILGVLLGIWR